jgi:hypothetical protein
MNDDPFDYFGDAQLSQPTRKKLARKNKKLAAKLDEKAKLYIQWQKWHADERAAFLKGPYGKEASSVAEFLAHLRLTADDAVRLVDIMRDGPWLTADPDTRFRMLRMVDYAIIAAREQAGLVPFDDALPTFNENEEEEQTAFLVIRDMFS